MTYRFASLLLLLAPSCGCRACSDCYDYSSPVSYSSAAQQQRRAGSSFAKADVNLDVAPSETEIELTSYALDQTPQAPRFASEPIVADPQPVKTGTPMPPLLTN